MKHFLLLTLLVSHIFFLTSHLQEFTVLPSEENPFPSADWLIGNHSDELTPWIPVMAARHVTSIVSWTIKC